MEQSFIEQLFEKHFDRLQEIETKIDQIRSKDIPALQVQVEGMRVKVSLWGGLSGSIGGALAALLLLAVKILTGS